MTKRRKKHRPTLADVARRAGVGKATASRALNHDPRTARKTAENVRRVADEMGYLPNPMLAALASRRFASEGSFEGLPLAYIVGRAGRSEAGSDKLFAALARECDALGYALQYYNLGEKANPRRFSSELYHRGVGGIFLGRTEKDRFIERYGQMDWSPFSVVSLENNLPTPAFHLVRVDVWESIRICWQRFRARGLQRIGFVLLEAEEPRLDDEIREGAALKCLMETGEKHRVGIVKLKDTSAPELEKERKWFQAGGPEAVIVFNEQIAQFIDKDLELGEKVEIALLHRSTASGKGWPGIWQDPRKIARPASALMDRLFRHGEVGIPDNPQRVYILPEWFSADDV